MSSYDPAYFLCHRRSWTLSFVGSIHSRVREAYLFHRDESILGPLFARGAHHLWKWNGRELLLLEEAFETWAS